MLFADNVYRHINAQMYHTKTMIFCQPIPLPPPSLLYLAPHMIQHFFVLTWRSSFFCSWCEYPSTLLSLVCYQLSTPCCFTHPKAPHRSCYIFTQTTSTTSAVPSDTVNALISIPHTYNLTLLLCTNHLPIVDRFLYAASSPSKNASIEAIYPAAMLLHVH